LARCLSEIFSTSIPRLALRARDIHAFAIVALPLMACLVCPAVLRCKYMSGGRWHHLDLAFALNTTHGQTHVLGLYVTNNYEYCWSGWHGTWHYTANRYGSSILLWVHYRGEEQRLVAKRIFVVPCCPDAILRCGFMHDRNADVHVSFCIETVLFPERQLEDNEWFVVEEQPSVQRPLWRRILVGTEIVWQNEAGDVSYVPWNDADSGHILV